MKRRTFNKAALAGLAGGIGAPLCAGTGRTETTVKECIRHADCQDEWDWVPFTIGLGRCGRKLAAQLDRVIETERPALIYAESDRSAVPAPTPTQLGHSDDDLLSHAYSGVLIMGLDEPEIWPHAITWAEKMRAQDVYMTTAIICVPDLEVGLSHPLIHQLKKDLHAVILHQDCGEESLPAGSHPVLQSARLFMMEQGLICHDIADIRTVLNGKIAITSTFRSLPSSLGGNLQKSVDACYAELCGRPVCGGIARWSAGLETLSVKDFGVIGSRMGEKMIDDCTLLLTTSFDLSLTATSPGILHTIWTLIEDS